MNESEENLDEEVEKDTDKSSETMPEDELSENLEDDTTNEVIDKVESEELDSDEIEDIESDEVEDIESDEIEDIESDEIEEAVMEGKQERLDDIDTDYQESEEEIERTSISYEEFEERLSLEYIEASFTEELFELFEDVEVESEESAEEEAARIARQVQEFHKCQIEAALYASGKPLSIEVLSTKLEFGKREAEELLNELAFDYLERSTALVIAHVGDRYQMQIKPEYTEKVSKFAEGGAIAEKYLRTLTIIALKQPILKSLVIKLRGTGAYEHVKYLLDNALIEARKKGRSHELTTTDKYAEMFGLPKDKNEMKRVMVAQLGLDEGGQQPE